jgi:hypothetical protein
VSFP